MKLETAVIIFKALAHTLVGIFTPWTAALAQWVNSDTWPSRIIWIGVILPASVVGGASGLLAFLSGSFKEYQKQRTASQDSQQLQPPPAPPTPT